jgi:hypothetical protein
MRATKAGPKPAPDGMKHRDIIHAIGGTKAVARACAVSIDAVAKWRQRSGSDGRPMLSRDAAAQLRGQALVNAASVMAPSSTPPLQPNVATSAE